MSTVYFTHPKLSQEHYRCLLLWVVFSCERINRISRISIVYLFYTIIYVYIIYIYIINCTFI